MKTAQEIQEMIGEMSLKLSPELINGDNADQLPPDSWNALDAERDALEWVLGNRSDNQILPL